MASPGIWRNGCQKWREAVFHHRSNSKYYTYIIPWVFHIMPYMLQSFAEYARNLISRKKRKIVRSIISFHLLSFCECASLFMIFCVLAFTGSRGETIQWRSFSFVLSHVQLHMRVFLVCNLVAITRLNSIFDEKDDDDGHPSYKPFCGCYMLFTACVKLPSS